MGNGYTTWFFGIIIKVSLSIHISIITDDLDGVLVSTYSTCLLYTSDAADEEDSVDLGGRRNIKNKKKKEINQKKKQLQNSNKNSKNKHKTQQQKQNLK